MVVWSFLCLRSATETFCAPDSQKTMKVENKPSFRTRFFDNHSMKSDPAEDKYTRKA